MATALGNMTLKMSSDLIFLFTDGEPATKSFQRGLSMIHSCWWQNQDSN